MNSHADTIQDWATFGLHCDICGAWHIDSDEDPVGGCYYCTEHCVLRLTITVSVALGMPAIIAAKRASKTIVTSLLATVAWAHT